MLPKLRTVPLLLLAGLASDTAGAEPWGSLAPGEHDVGFMVTEVHDLARSVRTGDPQRKAVPRPVRVYVWYPAAAGTQARPMTFGEYAAHATDDVWPDRLVEGARARLAFEQRPLARSLTPEDLRTTLAMPVRAIQDAPPAAGPFPLIVIGQGLYYESPISHAFLSEYLASHGFVVASSPLVGTHSPLVKIDLIDLETQVRDLELVISRVRQEPFVSPERLGLVGFDMGGMAGLILSMRNADVDVLVSLDCALLFSRRTSIPSGIPATAQDYDPALLRQPWLHVVQRGMGVEPFAHDGPSLFDRAHASDRSLLLVDDMAHADFTSFALIPNRRPMAGYWGPWEPGIAARHETVCSIVRHFLASHLQTTTGTPQTDAVGPFDLRRHIEVNRLSGMMLEHMAADSVRPDSSDFLNALLSGHSERATELARAMLEQDPRGWLANESLLNRLGYRLLSSWQMADEAVAVFKLNRELHPRSPNVHDSLGEAAMAAGRAELAASCFRQLLELQPGNKRAAERLEKLESELGESAESP